MGRHGVPLTEAGTQRVAAPPQVVVVDDHRLFRSGLTRLLVDEGIAVIGEADTGETALEVVAATAPDVVLMDLNLPGISGIEATRRLIAADPTLSIVVLTVIEVESDVIESLVAGACGYLLKDASVEDIVDAIHAAVRGESLISPAIAAKLVSRVRAAGVPSSGSGPTLSERELDVLRLICEGCENRQIAAALFISESTVKHHISSLLTKLEVGNRVQAAVRAVRDGLI
jgi:DNA-binding NarL/FixJ family response regulator